MTTSLRARINELRRLREGHQVAQNEAERIGRVGERAKELRKVAERLSSSGSALRSLRSRRVPIDLPENMDIVVSAVKDARAGTAADGLWAGADTEPALLMILDAHATKLEAALEAGWSTYQRRKPPPRIDEELLRIASDHDVSLISRHATPSLKVEGLAKKLRPTTDDIESWSQNVDVLINVADAVARHAPSESVVDFLRVAQTNRGADLSALDDPDIQEWLAQGDRSSAYGIRARGASRGGTR